MPPIISGVTDSQNVLRASCELGYALQQPMRAARPPFTIRRSLEEAAPIRDPAELEITKVALDSAKYISRTGSSHTLLPT